MEVHAPVCRLVVECSDEDFDQWEKPALGDYRSANPYTHFESEDGMTRWLADSMFSSSWVKDWSWVILIFGTGFPSSSMLCCAMVPMGPTTSPGISWSRSMGSSKCHPFPTSWCRISRRLALYFAAKLWLPRPGLLPGG